MPISIEHFERDVPEYGGDSNAERILRLLASHPDQAFTRSEIAERTGVTPNSVGPVLSRLKERGLVRHRGTYWAVNEDAPPVADAETTPSQTEAQESHQEAATAYAERIERELGESIDALYLFGSVARETARATSDVDFLAVIAEEADYNSVDERLLSVAFDIQLEYDVPIEVHTMRAAEFAQRRARGEPFVQTVLEEGRQYV